MKKPPVILDNTPEEEAEAQRQLTTDPDTWETASNAKVLKRGRPAGQTKTQVTVRLDNTLLEALKTPDPKGWQTRLNDAALRGLQPAIIEPGHQAYELPHRRRSLATRRTSSPHTQEPGHQAHELPTDAGARPQTPETGHQAHELPTDA